MYDFITNNAKWIQSMQTSILSRVQKREGCSRKGIWRKNTLGCMAGLILDLVCVPASGYTVRGMSERGQFSEREPAIKQGPHEIEN